MIPSRNQHGERRQKSDMRTCRANSSRSSCHIHVRRMALRPMCRDNPSTRVPVNVWKRHSHQGVSLQSRACESVANLLTLVESMKRQRQGGEGSWRGSGTGECSVPRTRQTEQYHLELPQLLELIDSHTFNYNTPGSPE